MPSDARMKIAQALTQAQAQNPFMSEPGLEQPPEMKALAALHQIAAGYGMGQLGGGAAQALLQRGLPAAQALGEAGAVFPEGQPVPPGMMKKDFFTPTENAFNDAELAYRKHMTNYDFQNALKDKWGMLRNWGGN